MSKRKKSNNYLKYNKNKGSKKFNPSEKNNVSKIDNKVEENKNEGLFIDESIFDNSKTITFNEIEDKKEIVSENINEEDILEKKLENDEKDTCEIKEENIEEVEKNIKSDNQNKEVKEVSEDKKIEQVSSKKENTTKIEVEKSIETKELKVIGKRNFFVLLFKFILLMILSLFKTIGSFLKKICIHIKDFFEDEAEELDRKIREIKDEEVIKNQKRNLDYEKYNTKRIYKDLERAEKYRERANSRVNTEKYYEDEIEKEKINNRIIVSENVDSENGENINNIKNNLSKKSRIEKKKNEILELRKRKKEQRDEKRKKLREEKNKRQEEQKRIDEIADSIKAEEERIIKETEDLVKSMERQLKLSDNSCPDDDYNSLFSNEFGTENDLDNEIDNKKEEIIKKNENNEIKKNIEKEKENRPEEKITVDSKTKRDILRYIDVPEAETEEPFETNHEEKEKNKEEKKQDNKNENDTLFEKSDPSKVRVSENQDGFKKALLNIEKNNMEHNEELIYGKHLESNDTFQNYERKLEEIEMQDKPIKNQTIIVNNDKLEEIEEIKNSKKEENEEDKKKTKKKNKLFLNKKEKREKKKEKQKQKRLEKNEELKEYENSESNKENKDLEEIKPDENEKKEKKESAFLSFKNNISQKIELQKEKIAKKKKERKENENTKNDDIDKKEDDLKQNIKENEKQEEKDIKKTFVRRNIIRNNKGKEPRKLNNKFLRKDNERFEFNAEEYTNKFIKNIIGEQDFSLSKDSVKAVNSDMLEREEIIINADKEKSYENLERRNIKIEKNKKKIKANNSKEKNINAGEKIKDLMNSVGLKFSEVSSNAKRKKERKNRIRRNQIYSTSYNKKNRRR